MSPRTRHLATRRGATRAVSAAALLVALPLLSLGCATLGPRGESLVPTRYQVRTGPFLLYSNTPVPADSPAIRCLHSLETDLTNRLAYRTRPDEEPVEIYVLNDRNAYTHFLKFYYPELPPRRAFFLAQGDRRVIYTFLSDRLEEDLRHEATHALVRGCHGDLPLWLDEGLAEYFETRSASEGGNDEHLAKIAEDLRSGWTPDMPRLESLADIRQMTPRDYRESWAWVHLLIEAGPSTQGPLLDYLRKQEPGKPRGPLSAALAGTGVSPAALAAHLQDCQARLAARQSEPQPLSLKRDATPGSPPRTAARGEGARELTSAPTIVRAQTPPRPSLLRRLGSLLGL